MTESLKLLYVDDDPDIRTIVEMALGLDPMMTVRTARSGAEALALVDSEGWRPDVVVLDVMMPGMDGIATMRALRQVAGLEATPTLFMTAKGREADVDRYHAEGVAGVILKPFDPMRLAKEIRMLTARRGAGS